MHRTIFPAPSDAAGAAAAARATSLQKAQNLADLESAASARTNLALGTAATHAATDFDAAGAAAAAQAAAIAASDPAGAAAAAQAAAIAVSAQKAQNLADMADIDSARANVKVPVLRSCQAVALSNQALSGALPTIDGYAVQDADRVLLAGQTTASQNGPWLAHTAGWVRPNDYPAAGTVLGRAVLVNGGATYASTFWQMAATTNVTIDTTATTWSLVGRAAGTGLALSGNTLSVSYGTAGGTAAQGNDSRITGAEQASNKGAASGYGSLDSSGRQPTGEVPLSVANASSRQYDLRDYLAGGTDARVGLAGAVAAAVAYIQGNSKPASVYIPAGIWTYASSVSKAALIGSADTGGGAGLFNNQGVPLPVNLPALLEIYFEDGAIVQLGGGARNAFYIDKLADYDTFQHVHFHNATVDNANVTGRCHVLIGNIPASATKQRYLSFSDIHFYGKTKILNVPVDATQATSAKPGIAFIGDHNGPLEATQTSSIDIDVHDIEMNGGDGAVGVYSTAAARVRPGGCNHYYHRIKVRRWRHINPAAATAQIFQTSVYICGAGFGDRFEIGPGFSQNIGDDAIEIGAMQSGTIDGAHLQDFFFEGILFRHTHALTNPYTQRVVVRNLKAKITSALSQGSTGHEATPLRFYMDDGTVTLTMSGSPAGGTFTYSFVTTAGTLTTAAIAWNASAAAIATAVQTALAGTIAGATCTGTGGPINSAPVTLTIGNVNLVFGEGGGGIFPAFSNNGGLTGGSSPGISSALSTASPVFGTFIIEDAVMDADSLQYTKQAAVNGDLFIRGLDMPVRRVDVLRPKIYLSNYNFDAVSTHDLAFIHPLSSSKLAWPQTVNVRDMEVTLGSGCQLNSASGGGRMHMIAPEGQNTQTNIDGMETDWSGATGGGSVLMVGVGHNTGGGNIHVNAKRLKPLATASGTSNTGLRVYTGGSSIKAVKMTECDFSEVSIGGTELTNSIANGLVHAYGNTYSTKPAPATLTGLTTATGAQLTAAYSQIASFVQGSGSGITAIDYSTDGGTHYTNFLTQASGALPAGFDQSIGPLPPGSLIKVTFATTQPTINLVPYNP